MPFPNISFPHPSSCMLQNMYEQDGGTAVGAPAVVAPAAVAPPVSANLLEFNWWCTRCTGVHDTECMCCGRLTRHPLILLHQIIAAPTPPPKAAEKQAYVESAEAKASLYDPDRPMMMQSGMGTARPAPFRHQTSAEYERSQGPYDRLETFRAQSNRDYEETRLEQKRLEYKEFGRDAPMAVSALPPTAQGRHRIQAPTLPPLEGMCLSLLIRCM